MRFFVLSFLIPVFSFLISTNLIAQPVLNASKTQIRTNDYTETFSITDQKNNIHIFFVGYYGLAHLKYDSSFSLMFEKTYKVVLGGNSEVQGYYYDDQNQINIYFSNPGMKKFILFKLGNDGDFEIKDFGFTITDEKIIKKINFQNNFILITILKKTSVFKTYVFEEDGYTEKVHDFSKENFFTNENKMTSLWDILKKQEVQLIEDDIPTAIEISSEPIKIYPRPEQLIMTLNHRQNATRTLFLNLDDQPSQVDYFNFPIFRLGEVSYYKSNSFVYKNVIYQLLANRKQLVFQIFDLPSKSLIKEYAFGREDDITFKNSPIYQGDGSFSVDDEQIYDTKEYLRKITASDLGLAVYEKKGNIVTTIGGTKEMRTGAGVPLPMGGIAIASIGAVTISVNPIFTAFHSYSNTRSVYTRCLFNKTTFNHEPGFAGINVFDLIAIYKDYEIKDIKPEHETIFKYSDFFIYGYLTEDEYRLIQFEE